MRRNLDLDSISRETKISSRFLDAIETEQFEKLPGGVFARSFVRQYARLLELDEEQLVGALDQILAPAPAETAPAETPARHDQPEPRIPLPKVEDWQSAGDGNGRFKWSSALPAAAGVIVVMLVCSLIYGWWQRSRQPAPVEAPQVTAAKPPAPPAQSPPQPQTQGQAPLTEPQPAAPAETKVTPVVAQPTAPAPGSALPPSPPAVPGATVKIQVTAQEPTWLLIRTDGKYLFSGTLDTNESRTIEAAENVLLRLGNAGGVTVTHNGKPLGAPGPKGQVRTLQFTSGGFQAVPAASAAPKPAPLIDPL